MSETAPGPAPADGATADGGAGHGALWQTLSHQ